MALRVPELEPFEDKWELVKRQLNARRRAGERDG
jgi:hypothetical protein